MNIATLLFNDLYSCPLKLVVDDTGIGSGYKTLIGCVIFNLQPPCNWLFLTFNPQFEGRRYAKIKVPALSLDLFWKVQCG